MVTERDRIASLFEQALDQQPYYGPSLLNLLQRITLSTAAFRLPDTHSIWEIIAHMTAEMNYSGAVLDGHTAPWIEGETTWPKMSDESEASWQQTTNDFEAAYRDLVSRIKRLTDEQLNQRNRIPVDRSIYEMLCGTLQHNIYHAGQIALMLRVAK